MTDKTLKTDTCGCKVIKIGGAGMSADNIGATFGIEYCPKHKAAPLLVEALEMVMARQEIIDGRVVERGMPSSEEILTIQRALSAARGE